MGGIRFLKRPKVYMCAIYTRAQQAELRENDRLDAKSGAIPRPMSLNPKPRPVPKPRHFKPQQGIS